MQGIIFRRKSNEKARSNRLRKTVAQLSRRRYSDSCSYSKIRQNFLPIPQYTGYRPTSIRPIKLLGLLKHQRLYEHGYCFVFRNLLYLYFIFNLKSINRWTIPAFVVSAESSCSSACSNEMLRTSTGTLKEDKTDHLRAMQSTRLTPSTESLWLDGSCAAWQTAWVWDWLVTVLNNEGIVC